MAGEAVPARGKAVAKRLLKAECALLAEFLTIFAHPTRMLIFCALQDGRKTVSELAKASGVSLQNISQHLRIMRDKGAVAAHKEGQWVYYQLIDDRIIQGTHLIREALVDQLRRQADRVGPAATGEADDDSGAAERNGSET